jgi:hypothetical protein
VIYTPLMHGGQEEAAEEWRRALAYGTTGRKPRYRRLAG